MAKKIRNNNDNEYVFDTNSDANQREWIPSKTHSIEVDSAVYQEITELLKTSGMTIEEMLMDMAWTMNKDLEQYVGAKARTLNPKGTNKDTKKLKVALDTIEGFQKARDRIDESVELKKRLKTFEYNYQRTKTDIPKTFITNVRRMEILLNIASCENNKLSKEMNIVKSEFTSSSREDIKNMVDSKLKSNGIFTIFPEWQEETSRKNLLVWHKQFENDLAWLKNNKYIYTKKDELYVDKDEFTRELANEMFNMKKAMLNTYVHSYTALAQAYDVHLSDNKNVARWYAKNVTDKPFKKVTDIAIKEDNRRRKGI